jgi:hypothetical protein
MDMPDFHVMVKRGASAPDSSLLNFARIKSQNAMHAAACGLSLAGGGYAEVIEVHALAPVPGRPVLTVFQQCSQGVYGFCFTSRSS